MLDGKWERVSEIEVAVFKSGKFLSMWWEITEGFSMKWFCRIGMGLSRLACSF